MLTTVCACAKLRRSARIVSAVYDEALAPAGLTVAQFSLLRMLERRGPCSLTAFGEATGHDRTTLNRTLKPLEERGLVVSKPGKDQRQRVVGVTDAGRRSMQLAHPHWERAQARVEEKLGPDHSALFAILDRIEELRP